MGQYTIDYYKLYRGNDAPPLDLRAALRRLVGMQGLVSGERAIPREIKELREVQGVFTGIAVKYRVRDLPHKGAPGGDEDELGLRDDEGIIEKTHFLIAPGPDVLLLQRNRNAATYNTIAGLLGEFLNEIIIFAPVLQPDAIERLMRRNGTITHVDVAVTSPSPEQLARVRPAAGGWSADVLSLMGNTEAATLSFTIKGNLHARDDRRFLGQNIVTGIRRLFRSPVTVKKARVWFDSDEQLNDFIDLTGDGFVDIVDVEDAGRYPNSIGIFTEMRRLWQERRLYLRDLSDREGR